MIPSITGQRADFFERQRSHQVASRGSSSVLTPLNGGESHPLSHCPAMVGESRRHGRGSLPNAPPLIRFLERSHRPAEVIAVQAEVGHRLVNTPILRERVALADLPRVAM